MTEAERVAKLEAIAEAAKDYCWRSRKNWRQRQDGLRAALDDLSPLNTETATWDDGGAVETSVEP